MGGGPQIRGGQGEKRKRGEHGLSGKEGTHLFKTDLCEGFRGEARGWARGKINTQPDNAGQSNKGVQF